MKYFKVTYRNAHFRTHTDYIKAHSLEAAQVYADSTAKNFDAPHDGVTECEKRDLKNGNGCSIVDLTDRDI